MKLVNKIIIDAYNQNASDIHIEPYPGKAKTEIRFRKDGSLVPGVVAGLLFGAEFLMPVYLQAMRGRTALEAGTILLAVALASGASNRPSRGMLPANSMMRWL